MLGLECKFKKLLIVALSFLAVGCATVLAPEYGIREGRLKPCPVARDCVSSQDPNPERRIEPLIVATDRREARDDLMRAMLHFDGVRIVSVHRNYLRAEFPAGAVTEDSGYEITETVAVDDVEFYMPPDGQVYHVRSVSRLGSPSMLENRERIARLREFFYQHQEEFSDEDE